MSGAEFATPELWGRRCFDEQLNHLGNVEALSYRGRHLRAIGIRVPDDNSERLVFVDMAMVHIDDQADLIVHASAGKALGRVRIIP